MSVSPYPDGSCFLHGDFYGECPECAARRAAADAMPVVGIGPPCPECDGEGYTFGLFADKNGILDHRRVPCADCGGDGLA